MNMKKRSALEMDDPSDHEREEQHSEEEEEDEDADAGQFKLEDLDLESDEEIQEAFAAGLIKPGLNTVYEVQKKKPAVNNVNGLKQKLDEFKLDLPWIERLDMINKPAPLAPELAYKEDQHAKERLKMGGKHLKSLADDPVHNDFLREMLFYRQAQSAVLEAIPRLKSMDIPTKRPEDYFAQMAKSDQHMQKIREKLVSKQMTEERLEKVRKLRELRKFGKKVQVEVQLQRQKEKREMLEQVKKFRKGQTDSLDFLEEPGKSGKKKAEKTPQDKKASMAKRKQKDKKFGFGGKKRGMKLNTKSSVDDVSSFRSAKKGKKSAPNLGQKLKNKRLGKSRRQKAKNKRK